MITSLVFYVYSAILLASGVMVVSTRNPVNAVLFLILCFVNAAGLFLLMGAEFLAFILLIVYVGAVAVLFLFVVMMLDISFKEVRREFKRYVPVAAMVGLVLLVELVLVASAWIVDPAAVATVVEAESAVENTRALGRVLYTEYFYPFQVAGFILLVSMIGAIVLTHRERKGVRRQSVARQIDIRVSDVVEVKKVSSGKGAEL